MASAFTFNDNFEKTVDKPKKNKEIKLVIPDEINELYNNSLFKQKMGDNTLIGYKEQLSMLDSIMYNPGTPIAVLLGQAGVGKTALIEQWIYNRSQTDTPVVVVGLNLERLGELNDNVVVSRMRTLLSAMQEVKKATAIANHLNVDGFQMVLFLDEIHKLAYYGKASDVGSGAMNALKEETARGSFPMIGATTKMEFNKYLAPDEAFSRRFGKITMKEPPKEDNVIILRRLLDAYEKQNKFVPMVTDKILTELVEYANAYIWNQANPAKSVMIINKAIGLCTRDHAKNHQDGLIIDHARLRQTFLSEGVDIDSVGKNEVKLIIPPDIESKYNFALKQLKNGDNTLIGYGEQLEMLDAFMLSEEQPNALLLAPQGSGKTALIEQWAYNRSLTNEPVAIVSLQIETLGEIGSDKVVARMRTLLDDLRNIRETTQLANPDKHFQMVLFIDEIHKLNNYGHLSKKAGSSGAMNALKEGLARGVFPLIGATTDYEYRENIVPDPAFDRRLGKVILEQPDFDTTVEILRRRLVSYQERNKFVPNANDKSLYEIVEFSDAYIRNQVNPAKSLSMLDKCIGFCRKAHLIDDNDGLEITHQIIAKAFISEDYEIDMNVTPEHVKNELAKGILGQPLALSQVEAVVNNALLSKRDFKKPLMTAFFVGTTGVGKSETAKKLAHAFFGRDDAILVLNGGDYVTKDSAIKAQHFIGDSVAVTKRQIILLDEIEKADISVMDSFMRMIDDGIVRDSNNVERSINSTIVIATSNLGAKIFSQLAETMDLDAQMHPNELSTDLEVSWFRQEATVRKALQNGDEGKNNGIKPEFLERFQLFVPYLPLTRKVISMIARMQLEKFQKQMRNGKYGIEISLPSKEPHEFWQRQMSSERTEFSDIDPISVMIAKDIIGSEADTTGARSISRYINGRVKTMVLKKLAERISQGLPYDGVFRLSALNPSFETNSGARPDVLVEYIDKDEL